MPRCKIDDLELGAAVVSGLGNAADAARRRCAPAGSDLHFIEVMTCPGGCINGGGQAARRDARGGAGAACRRSTRIDRDGRLRTAHGNESVRRLYDEFLGEPLGELSHQLLHTHYAPREVVR